MKCVICRRGEPRPGFATVALTRDESVFVLKGVPADICQDYRPTPPTADRTIPRSGWFSLRGGDRSFALRWGFGGMGAEGWAGVGGRSVV
jgi:hypothetical protein